MNEIFLDLLTTYAYNKYNFSRGINSAAGRLRLERPYKVYYGHINFNIINELFIYLFILIRL